MINLLWVLLLGLAWTAWIGELTFTTLLAGLAIGYAVLLFRREVGPRLLVRMWHVAVFWLYFLGELVKANLRVARDVLALRPNITPGVIEVPLDIEGDARVTLVANLVTLTPGSLSLDVSADRKVLYVHTLYADDPERARDDIKRGFERRAREAFE